MRVGIPLDGNPIKYWENGDLKYCQEWIHIKGGEREIYFAIFPKFEPELIDVNSMPNEQTIRKALYRMVEDPNCEGIASYKFVRLE